MSIVPNKPVPIHVAMVTRLHPSGVAAASTRLSLHHDGTVRFTDADGVEVTAVPSGAFALLCKSVFPRIHGINWLT